MEVLVQVCNNPPKRPSVFVPDLPRELERICLKCLEKLPKNRYQSAGDLAADLQRFRSGGSTILPGPTETTHVASNGEQEPATLTLPGLGSTVAHPGASPSLRSPDGTVDFVMGNADLGTLTQPPQTASGLPPQTNPTETLGLASTVEQNQVSPSQPPQQLNSAVTTPNAAASLQSPEGTVDFIVGNVDLVAMTLLLQEESEPQVHSNWPNIPEYEILQELGRGGMGTVYLARHVNLNRLVAIKFILDSHSLQASTVRRFVRMEAQAMAALNHPNIVQIHDLGWYKSNPFLVTEFVKGGSLRDTIRRGEPQPIRAVAELMEQTARTMGYVHEQGFVHRDLKPGNILVTGPLNKGRNRPGNTQAEELYGTVKIADFGLSRRYQASEPEAVGIQLGTELTDDTLTQAGAVMGTPIYMPPEQASGNSAMVGPPADVYSLGVMLYELLTGLLPFSIGDLREFFYRSGDRNYKPVKQLRPEVPSALEAICHRCLSLAPENRYPTGKELADDLRCFLDGRPTSQTPTSWWGRLFGWR